MLLHADRILNPELFHWRNISTADLGIFSLGRKISASQSLPRNIFASENIPAGKSILAEYSGCYIGNTYVRTRVRTRVHALCVRAALILASLYFAPRVRTHVCGRRSTSFSPPPLFFRREGMARAPRAPI